MEKLIDLKGVYEWMNKGGPPNPAENMPADTIILMDIALSMRHMIGLYEQALEMNQAIMMQMDRNENDRDN